MKITRRRLLGLAGASAALGMTGHSNTADVADVTIALPGLRSPLRALFVSDMHMPWCLVLDSTLRDAAEEFRPDVLLVGGDDIDKVGNEHLVEVFAALPARIGKFAILGNWEYASRCSLALLRERYAAAGVRLLVNEALPLPDAEHGNVRLVGLDDHLYGRPQASLAAPPDPGSAPPTIVLAHCPVLFDQLPPGDLLCLSGHTHGGQIAPFGVALYVPPGSGRYVAGLYRAGERRLLYVTRGLGNNTVPFRIGSRPEIVRLTLVPAVA